MQRILTFLLGAIVTAIGMAATAQERVFHHDGIERRALIEGPLGEGPRPAIIALHGGAGTAYRMKRLTRFPVVGDGWIEIYPQGLDRAWNDGRRALSGGALRTTDDVGFLKRLIAELVREGHIDAKRIYFAGISNGGAMVQRLVCQAPELVAGAAIVIMGFPVGLDCPPGRSVPMLFQLGTDDPIVPFHGGPITVGVRDRGAVMPAQDTLDFYARRNGCRGRETRKIADLDPADETTAHRIIFTACQAATEAIIVTEGGHTWSGRSGRPALQRLLGKTSRDFDASAEIAAFFRRLDAEQ